MKLMTKKLVKRFAQVGRQEEIDDPTIVAKFFNPIWERSWYATEYDPENRIFYGYMKSTEYWNDGWGFFWLDDLEAHKGSSVLETRRDQNFQKQLASKVINNIKKGGE